MPENLIDIGVEELDRLKVGEKSNGLYWDNKRVQTESVVVLSPKQGRWAFVVGLAAIVTAGASVFAAYAAMQSIPKAEINGATSPQPVDPNLCTIVLRVDQGTRELQVVSNQCGEVQLPTPSTARQH